MPAARVEAKAFEISVGDRSCRPGRFELRILYPNRPFAVRRALRCVMMSLSDLGLSQDCSANVELVLAEVLNNVAEHAYPDDPTGLVEVRILRREDYLTFRVADEGRPMPLGRLPIPAQAEFPRCEGPLPEGGFGWFLIRTLTRGLTYERRDGTNRLSFELHFHRNTRGS